MKKALTIIMCIVISAVLLAAEFSVCAYASSEPLECVSVKVKTGGEAYSGEFLFQLTAESENAPMPKEASGGIYKFKIENGKSASLPKVEYTRVGKYEYLISQIPGNEKDVKYDDAKYKLVVYVLNGENDGFEYSYAAYKNGSSKKASGIEFENSYLPTTAAVIIETTTETPTEVTTTEPETETETATGEPTTKTEHPIIEKIEDIINPFTGSDIKTTISIIAVLITAIIVTVIEFKKIKK